MPKKEFQIGGPRSNFVLLVCSTLYMVNYMDRQVLSVVLEPMKLDLGLTDTQAGLGESPYVPCRMILDRWGGRV